MTASKDAQELVRAIDKQTRVLERIAKALENSNRITVDIARKAVDDNFDRH